jgi:hypothetical protein
MSLVQPGAPPLLSYDGVWRPEKRDGVWFAVRRAKAQVNGHLAFVTEFAKQQRNRFRYRSFRSMKSAAACCKRLNCVSTVEVIEE